jgi:hypothetical protein
MSTIKLPMFAKSINLFIINGRELNFTKLIIIIY